MKNLAIFLATFILAAIGCKPAEKAVSYTPENIVPTEKSLAWKISGKGLKKPSYLYGTIHMIPKKEFELPGAIREGLDNVRRVTFEIDMKEMTNLRSQMSLLTKSFMAGGKTLKDLLNAEDYKLVKDKMAEKGLPSGMFERMKPMFLSTLFSSDETGPAASEGITSVEMELYKMSRRRKLESAGLETAAFQMSVFDSIPYSAQAKMLVDGLRSMDTTSTGEGQLDLMLR
ncbi:MAG: TraB/GumN family protein, partial [Saprospiraceae bacterium]